MFWRFETNVNDRCRRACDRMREDLGLPGRRAINAIGRCAIAVDMPTRQDAKFLDHRRALDRRARQYRPGHLERVARDGQHRLALETHGRDRHRRTGALSDAFLRPVTDNPRIELALCRSYNRWMADIWSKDKKRLRWAVQLPLMTMDQALDELRWSHGNGACAVFMRGIETNHSLHDPYFFPLYEEASRLNLPIGIHSGIGNFTVNEMLGGEPFRVAKLIVIGGFHSMILNGIPEKFPKLRIGAIEVAAQWVPYLVHDLNLAISKAGRQGSAARCAQRQRSTIRRLPDRRRSALRAQVCGRKLLDDRFRLRPCG